MKILKQFVLLLVVLLFGSCSNDYMESANQSSDSSSLTTRVDMQTALERAEKMLAKIEDGKTRSRRVASIRYLNIDGKTRAGGSLDSLYYIINYADNGGFAIAGADTRLDGIYAISEEGHLEESDILENPGLEYFFDLLPDEETIELLGKSGYGFGKDTTIQVGPPIVLTDVDVSEKRGPYIHPNVSQWNQTAPFNNECPVEYNEKCYAGCVPVAAAIVMSFHEWPTGYNNKNYDWQAIKNATVGNQRIIPTFIPNLLRDLGAGNNYDTEYHSNGNPEGKGSRSDIESHNKRTFRHFGYKEPEDFKDFENAAVHLLLYRTNSPIIMIGYNGKIKGSHAWVIDGYYNDVHKGTAYIGGYGGEGLMLHVIWGWGGSRNGYFKFGGSVVPKSKFNETYDDSRWGYDYWYDSLIEKIQFTSKLKYVGGFEPNK